MGREVLAIKHSNKKSSSIAAEILVGVIFAAGGAFGFIMPPASLMWLKYLLVILIPLLGVALVVYMVITERRARKAPNDIITLDRATNMLYVQTKKGEQQINVKDLEKSKQLQQTSSASVSAPFYSKGTTKVYGYVYLKTTDKKTIKSLRVENPSSANEQIRALIAAVNPEVAKKSKSAQKEADKKFDESSYR